MAAGIEEEWQFDKFDDGSLSEFYLIKVSLLVAHGYIRS